MEGEESALLTSIRGIQKIPILVLPIPKNAPGFFPSFQGITMKAAAGMGGPGAVSQILDMIKVSPF